MNAKQRLNKPVRFCTGAARTLLCLVAGACAVHDAGAVFTYAATDAPYGIILQVGSALVIDEVVFKVEGNNAGLTPAPVTGTNSANPSGVTIQISPSRPDRLWAETRTVTLTVDSSVALSCDTAASCGTTSIPFNTISWTSTEAAPAAGDIQHGAFTGVVAQQLATFNAATATGPFNFFNGDTRFLRSTLSFRYANSTIYPAGTYRGTVRFTATMV